MAGIAAFTFEGPAVPEMTLFGLDFLLACGLLLITFRFSSIWLGAAMLLQSVILFAHAMTLSDGEFSSFTFVVLNNIVSGMMYACLLGATLMSCRTRSRIEKLVPEEALQRGTSMDGAVTAAL